MSKDNSKCHVCGSIARSKEPVKGYILCDKCHQAYGMLLIRLRTFFDK